jgi:hypothetical protein
VMHAPPQVLDHPFEAQDDCEAKKIVEAQDFEFSCNRLLRFQLRLKGHVRSTDM